MTFRPSTSPSPVSDGWSWSAGNGPDSASTTVEKQRGANRRACTEDTPQLQIPPRSALPPFAKGGSRGDFCRMYVCKPALGINPGRSITAEHLGPLLIHGGNGQIDEILTTFLSDGFHGCFSDQGIPGPYLAREPHPKSRQAPIPHIVGQHLARHSHGQHAMGKHGGIPGNFGGVDLIRMNRVVIPRRARV